MIGASCFILDVEVELLQVCGPLLMVIILQFSLYLHELQWLMISVDYCLLSNNVMSPLVAGFHNEVHFFVISRVLTAQHLIVSHYDRPWGGRAEKERRPPHSLKHLCRSQRVVAGLVVKVLGMSTSIASNHRMLFVGTDPTHIFPYHHP
jgi:hypothetical protein